MTKATKKAGESAKARGGKKPPAAKAAPANTQPDEEAKADSIDPELEKLADEAKADGAKADEVKADEVKADEAGADQAAAETERILAKRAKLVAEAKDVIDIMDRCKSDKLFRNPKGEYFTVLNFAMLSVDQDRKKLEQFDRRLLEAIIKKAEA